MKIVGIALEATDPEGFAVCVFDGVRGHSVQEFGL
jgi:hypothetical protein